jgi:hypothetical protein
MASRSKRAKDPRSAGSHSPLTKDDWPILVKSIQQRKCVLLLGPGVVIDPDHPEADPLPVQLAQRLASKLPKARKGDSPFVSGDLAHVAQRYEREVGRRRGLETAVEEFYRPYRDKTTQLHRDLAALPFPIAISTTPEGYLRNAFQEAGKDLIYDFYHFQPDPRERHSEPHFPTTNPENQPLIYDLCGNLDKTDSLVLTENNLLDFLINVSREKPELHPFVTSQFSDRSVSFLFLGFGFRHWYIRILLHALKAGDHDSSSLALEDGAFFEAPEQQQTTLFFQKGHVIEFRKLSTDFAHDLREKFSEQVAQTQRSKPITPQVPAGAPTVFLCHDDRDKPTAKKFAEELRRYGIGIWFDEQNLRGGDKWENEIQEAVKKVDYVVVLQSPRMLDKVESWFKTEIDYALERQRGFGDLRFTIPVLLETHPKLPLSNLKHLHYIRPPGLAGVGALREAILEDWRKRASLKGTP